MRAIELLRNWTKIVVVVLSLHSSLSFAVDNRVQLKVKRFTHNGEVFHMIELRTEPLAWDQSPLTKEEVERRHAAANLLMKIQDFLKTMQERSSKKFNRKPELNRVIMQSFEKYPDPFGQLEWTDAGRTLHKVDEYFNRRSQIFVVIRGVELTAGNMVGTVKFVESDPQRLLAPIISDYKGFAPLPMATAYLAERNRTDIEYENLAANMDFVGSSVPLLLLYATHQPFFKDDGNTWIHLNAEESLTHYHEGFGFKVDKDFYAGLDAVRMTAKYSEFRSLVYTKMNERLKEDSHALQVDDLALKKDRAFQEVPWSIISLRQPEGYDLCEFKLLPKSTANTNLRK